MANLQKLQSKTQKKSDAENMGLDNLAPELRILVLAETWDGLSRDRRRRLLRVKPSFAILPLERCLCPLHTEALSCLIRTRTISELILAMWNRKQDNGGKCMAMRTRFSISLPGQWWELILHRYKKENMSSMQKCIVKIPKWNNGRRRWSWWS